MNPKLLCSDLDGTLLATKSDVKDFTISQINRIKDKARIVLVSARMPNGIRYLQECLGIQNQPIICYNGALVLDGTAVLDSVIIPVQIVDEIYALANPLETDLGLYYMDEWYVPKTSERVEKEVKYTKTNVKIKATEETLLDWTSRNIGAHKIMLMGTKESSDALMPMLSEKLGSIINIYRSNDTLIEIAPKSVSKLTAIKLLLDSNETLADVLAFGDNYNDMEMLTYCGTGVAVGNAREEVKKIADYITGSNTDEGVAHFIQRHVHI